MSYFYCSVSNEFLSDNLRKNKLRERAWISDLPIDDLDAARLLSKKWDPLTDQEPNLEGTELCLVSRIGIKVFCSNSDCPYHKTGWVYTGHSHFRAQCPKCLRNCKIERNPGRITTYRKEQKTR